MKGKMNKPYKNESHNIKSGEFNRYSSRVKYRIVEEGYQEKQKKKNAINTKHNKVYQKTNTKSSSKNYPTCIKTITATKNDRIQRIRLEKQKKISYKPQTEFIKNANHNPQQQKNKRKRLMKEPNIKQNSKKHPSQQQMLNLAKAILNKLKRSNQFANQCEELTRKIETDKTVSKQSSCSIFKLADLAISRATDQEKMNEEQQISQRAQVRQQINPKLFLCKILYDYEDFRQYLLQIMSKQCGKVTKTELIYRYDIYNKANIHKYIDNKPKLLFIVQTQQDFIIAAYTEAPFQVNTIPNAKSFIATLTNGRYYRKISDKKSLIYDPIYVVFGNSDLRIKGDQVFSNLGVNNSSYDSRGEKCHALFGEGTKNTTVIKQMEVFQVSFE